MRQDAPRWTTARRAVPAVRAESAAKIHPFFLMQIAPRRMGQNATLCDEGRNCATSLQLSDATAQPREGSGSKTLKRPSGVPQKTSVNLGQNSHKKAAFVGVTGYFSVFTASAGRKLRWVNGSRDLKELATRNSCPFLLGISQLLLLRARDGEPREVEGSDERSGGALCCT